VSEGGAERAVGELREGCSIEHASLPGQRWVLRRMVGREVAYEATAGTTPELQPHEIDASMPSGATYHEPGGTADKGSEGSPPQLPPLPADTPAKERWVALKNVSVVGGEKPRPSSKESGYLDKSWDGRRAKEARAAVAKLPEQHLGYLTYDIAGSPQVCGLLSADAQLEPCDGGWTCHIFRTHGLPAAGADSAPLFTDDGRAKLPKPCRRPGRGQGIADERRGLCLFDQATPKDLTLSLTRTRTLILTLALNPTPTPNSNLIWQVTPRDLSQGQIGDCWLIGSLAALAEFPEAVRKLCKQSALSPDGRYELSLFHPVEERWVSVVVDDRIAVDPQARSQPRYVDISPQHELWPCIYEKAFAPLFGGIANLDGNSPMMALKVLTGARDNECVRFQQEGERDAKGRGLFCAMRPTEYRQREKGGFENFSEYASWPDLGEVSAPGRGGELRPILQLLPLLSYYDDQGAIMCASCKTDDEEGVGLVGEHAYSLVEVELDIAGSGIDLLLLRNPWGGTEWRKAWSDGSPLWKKYPKVRDALGHEPDKNDGLFWMSADDFARHFDSITVCHAGSCKQVRRTHTRKMLPLA